MKRDLARRGIQRLLKQMRVAARVEEFPDLSGAYVAEVELMHREVMDYLTRHASQAISAGSESAPPPLPIQSPVESTPTVQTA